MQLFQVINVLIECCVTFEFLCLIICMFFVNFPAQLNLCSLERCPKNYPDKKSYLSDQTIRINPGFILDYENFLTNLNLIAMLLILWLKLFSLNQPLGQFSL